MKGLLDRGGDMFAKLGVSRAGGPCELSRPGGSVGVWELIETDDRANDFGHISMLINI